MTYSYDGSYQGLLTAVFTAFEYKEFAVDIACEDTFQPGLFETTRTVVSDFEKYQRVQKGLLKYLPADKALDFWRAYLAEDPEITAIVFQLIIEVFKGNVDVLQNYGDEKVLKFKQTLKKINRERHRMKAFVRFQKSADGMYLAVVNPDFNVLPLIIPFFRNRYADQTWLIYDDIRKYGIYYDLKTVTEVKLTLPQVGMLQTTSAVTDLDAKEKKYENLWQSYFQSTNIEARKNLKLHIQHVPKRYWRYLPEKQSALNSGNLTH